jgi:hypothetical protein
MTWAQTMSLLQVLGQFLIASIALMGAFGKLPLRPKLSFDPLPNIKHNVTLFRGTEGIQETSCIRISVVNNTRRLARNVIVKVVRIEKRSGEHLKNIDPYRAEIVGYFESMNIYPHDRSNMFDLIQASDIGYPGVMFLSMSSVMERNPRANPRDIPRDDYIFTVALYGDNIEPVIGKFLVLAKDRTANNIGAELLPAKV